MRDKRTPKDVCGEANCSVDNHVLAAETPLLILSPSPRCRNSLPRPLPDHWELIKCFGDEQSVRKVGCFNI